MKYHRNNYAISQRDNHRIRTSTSAKVSDAAPYQFDTTEKINQLVTRYAGNKRAIPVSFRKLVPWLKVGERATHYIHPYPAKLLPHIAHFFLASKTICPAKGSVLDPFGGTGTVALETCLSGRTAFYTDTNPLAQLIAETKTHPHQDRNIEIALTGVLARYRRSRSKTHPDVVNIEKWFEPAVIHKLSRLRAAIQGEANKKTRQLLEITFSATVRKVSNADPRLSVPVALKTKASDIDVLNCFVEQLQQNKKRYAEYRKLLTSTPSFLIGGTDARKLAIGQGGNLETASIDLVLTSPPYAGAQKYIRASSLSLGWLDLAGTGELKPLENMTIGREHLPSAHIAYCPKTSVNKANLIIERIRKVNPTRAAICATYINEMEVALQQIKKVIKKKGHLVLVIGNNYVCGEKFLSSNYLNEIIERLGFTLMIKMVDEIKSRGLMTKRNRTANVITREWILVYRND